MSTTAPASSAELASLANLYLLRKDIAFLNHGSFGACPRPVFETYQHWQRELEAQPVEFIGRRRFELFARARAALGDFVGAHADNLVFVPNVTVGMNAIARALPFGGDDEILSTDHEYGAVVRTWAYYAERKGGRFIQQPIAMPVTTAEALVEQLVISWGWKAEPTYRTQTPFIDHFEWGGTDDPSAYLSVPAAIEFQHEHNWPRVRAACHLLAADARERVAALSGLPQVAPDSTDWWVQMVNMPLPDVDPGWLKTRLWDDYQVEIPITSFQGRHYARISIQAYNNQAHVDQLVNALSALLPAST
jgi:selenocysteine lyase/cysteine desulfurase